MRKPRFHRRRVLAAAFPIGVAAALLGATGCGSESSGRAPDPSTAATTSAAVRIELHQTGGIAGVHDIYTVDSAVADQRRGQLFDLVGSQQFRTLSDSYLGPDECLDQFYYEVVVTYADNTTKNVNTDDCSQAPPLLTDVRALTKQIGVQTSHR
ncbi:hypothetical protein [Nocardia brasiliensis]